MARNATQVTHDLRALPKNAKGKWESSLHLESRGKTTWSNADAALLKAAVVAATEDGAGLLLSKTSDGGALTLYVLDNGSTHKLHPATADELTEGLQLVIEISSS